MNGPQAGFGRRVQGALEASPSRIPVVLGGCPPGSTFNATQTGQVTWSL